MGINPKDLLELVCIPACKSLNMFSMDALGLMMGTGAIESGLGQALIQRTAQGNPVIGGGFGWTQMQGDTHDDCWKIAIGTTGSLVGAFAKWGTKQPAEKMVTDLMYAAMMCRVQYSRFKEALPSYKDTQAVYNYYKKYWNTKAGASTLDKWMGVYPPIIMLLDKTTFGA